MEGLGLSLAPLGLLSLETEKNFGCQADGCEHEAIDRKAVLLPFKELGRARFL